MSSRRTCHDRGRIGFTLIEMLTVIAIIAILAGMLFPVFAAARERARRAKARATCAQLETAWRAYLEDHRTKAPEAILGTSAQMNSVAVNALNGDNDFNRSYMEFTNIEVADGMKDPWSKDGNTQLYQVMFDNDGVIDLNGETVYRYVVVWSMGKDGQAGTDDDITTWK